MGWTVCFSTRAAKQARKLPRRQHDLLLRLVVDLQDYGPQVPHWKNYSSLGTGLHHCHLSYRWVTCWRVHPARSIIEIYYTGSRENAPY